MKLTKRITSKRGNRYVVELELLIDEIHSFSLTDEKGNEIITGSGGSASLTSKRGDENYIVESVKNIVLLAEEKYINNGAFKKFENWDGIIK